MSKRRSGLKFHWAPYNVCCVQPQFLTFPPAPTLLFSSNITETTVDIFFTQSSNGGSLITNYRFSLNGGASFQELNPANSVSPITITGLSAETSYSIVLQAMNSIGNGDFSSPIFVTTTTPILRALNLTTNITQQSCRGAFGLKLLNSNYTGALLELRRSSDDLIEDFFGTNISDLKTSSNISLTTFLNGSNAFIVTLYDQSGKEIPNNAIQPISNLQPQLNITNEIIDTTGGGFFLIPDGTVVVGVLNSPYSFLVKHGEVNNINGAFIGAGGLNGNSSNVFRRNGSSYLNYWFDNDIGFSSYNSNNIVAINYDGTTQNGFINNTLITTRETTGLNTQSNEQFLFTSLNNEFLQGEVYYVYIFDDSISLSEMEILSANS
jgi:hypothetical protein